MQIVALLWPRAPQRLSFVLGPTRRSVVLAVLGADFIPVLNKPPQL